MKPEKPTKNKYPAYAVKSDDGRRTNKSQYPAYAVKSDDGRKNQRRTNILSLCCKKR